MSLPRRFRKRMYAVSKDGVGIIAGTMAYSRRAAINCLMHNTVNPEPDSWERFKRTGYRTVMAQIKIVRPSPVVPSQTRGSPMKWKFTHPPPGEHPAERLWRQVGLPEYFLGNGGTNTKLYDFYDAIVERCAKTGEKAWPRAHTYASENADLYRGQDHAAQTVVKAVRALALPRPHSNTPEK